MNVRPGIIALLAVYLPRLQDHPAPSLPVMTGVHALCDRAGSVSVAELATVAGYLADLAAHPSMPDDVRMVLLVVRASLLGLRVRNHHPRTSGGNWTDCCRASSSGSVTATMQVQVR